MIEWRVYAAIALLGLVSYALRAGGYLAAGFIRQHGALARFFRLAPGNLFVAFVAAICLEGGWTTFIGCAFAFIGMALTRKEWATLVAGFAAAAGAAGIGLR